MGYATPKAFYEALKEAGGTPGENMTMDNKETTHVTGSKLWLFPIVGIGYAIVYYTIFRVLIKALDLKTPGREDATEDAKATDTALAPISVSVRTRFATEKDF